MNLPEALRHIGSPRVLVVGDLILDRYTWGNAQRVSPEAPVLVLNQDHEESRLGGAASVACLLRGLDAEVALAGVLGDDGEASILLKLLEDAKVQPLCILSDPARPTTTKQRLLGRCGGRHPHQMLRVDRELSAPLDPEQQARLAAAVTRRLEQFQVLLISDYAKGVCTPRLLETAIRAARERNIPVLVDPARIADYARYRGASLLAPNRTEAGLATGRTIGTVDDALAAAETLRETCAARAVIVKLDRDGMVLVNAEGRQEHIPTTPREVHDVTGAGDMVLAMLGLTQAAGMPLAASIRLANVAAGIEVQRLGVAAVSRGEIQTELLRASVFSPKKLVTLDEMALLAESYRVAGRTIVLTNGCFDLLHVGHATYLEEASRLGDVLVVAVNSDRSVRELKGPDRPVIPEHDRAALLAALEVVDHVLVFDEDTPHQLLRRLRPDVLVKGGTYTAAEVVGREVVAGYGGRVCVTAQVESVSTTRILASVRHNRSGELDAI